MAPTTLERYTVRQPRIDPQQLARGLMKLPEVLHRMGYKALRKGQDYCVEAFLAGRDHVGILPTSCHALGQGVLMADGTVRKIEDIRVGEFVMGWDGTKRRVTHTKHGVAEMRTIRGKKRRAYTVTKDHLLTLVRTNEKARPRYKSQARGGEVIDISVREYETKSKWFKHLHKSFAVPVSEFHRTGRELDVDPYFLGVLLGDGCFTKGAPEVSKPDREIRNVCEAQAVLWGLGFSETREDDCPTYRLHNHGKHNNPLTTALKMLGLWGLGSPDKFIPSDYKLSGIASRRQLLAGLLDTDGSKSTGGYDFISASEKLAQDVAFVARSVGLHASDPEPCTKSCPGHSGTYWRLFISGAALVDLGMRIRRKQPDARTGTKRDVLRDGFTVEDAGEQMFAGITIEGDGRYLLDDFTVTHNTGKSACFAVPTLCLGWRTLVFSPLISLMRDQEKSMNLKGVRAGSITSQNPTLGAEYLRQWMRGELDLLYVAPERLRRDDFMNAMKAMPPDAVVCDEAHALSAWSVTFRSAYMVIGDFISEFQPKVVAAYSATLPPRAEADVRKVMCIENALQCMYYPRRTNLDIRSSEWDGDVPMITLMERVNAPTIVYRASTSKVEETAQLIQRMTGREVGIYHGKLGKPQRNHTQDMFQNGDLPWIVATNAFGMGVDHQTIRLVIHRDITGSVEAASQEIGRAGRDGNYALCHTYFDQDSVRTHKFLIDKSNPSFEDVRRVYNILIESVGRDGVVNTSLKDICFKAGFKEWRIDAIAQVLSGAQVIDRCKTDEKLCSIRLKNRISDPKLDMILGAVELYGASTQDGYLEVDIHALTRELDMSETTLKGKLKNFAANGVLDYLPPERARPVRLIGDLRQVDAVMVDQLRDEALTRLNQTIEFATRIPDSEKHQFLEHHLGVTLPP